MSGKFAVVVFGWVLLILCSSQHLNAQVPNANFTFPSPGMKDVPRRPGITIVTNYPIDSSSVTWDHPVGDSLSPDSTLPTIMVFERSIEDLSDTLWKIGAIAGDYTMPNPYTLVFTPRFLQPSTEYRAVIRNLRVKTGGVRGGGGIWTGGPVVYVPEKNIRFYTVRPPHKVIDVSIWNGGALCPTDTFYVKFSRPIGRPLSTTSGDLLQIKKLFRDSLVVFGDSLVPVTANYWFNHDSTIVYGTSSAPLPRGEAYQLAVNTGYLTGNSNDNLSIPFVVRRDHGLKIQVRAADSADTIPSSITVSPGLGEIAYEDGKSVTLGAGLPSDGFRFKRWESSDFQAINNSTQPSVSIVTCCRDGVVTAVFERIPRDTVAVSTQGGGSVVVYSGKHDSLGRAGNYPVYDGESVWAIAVPDSGYVFTGWQSNDARFNASANWAISVGSLGSRVNLKAIFDLELPDEPGEPEKYTYCGEIRNPDGSVNTNAVISITCHEDTTEGRIGTIAATIVNPDDENLCYRIVQRIDPDGTSHDYRPQGGLTSDQLTWSLLPTNPMVRFVVARVDYLLTYRSLLAGGGKAPPGAYIDISVQKPGNVFFCGDTVSLTAHDNEEMGVKFVRWEPSGITTKTLLLTMTEDKNVTAIFEEDFRLVSVEWGISGTTEPVTFIPPSKQAFDVSVNPASPSTYVYLNFNRPVDTDKLMYQSGEPKIKFLEQNKRLDFRQLGASYRQSYSPNNVSIAGWSDDNKRLTMLLHSEVTKVAVTKFQRLIGSVADLESTSGAKMKQSYLIPAHMENPGVRVTLDSFFLFYDTDPVTEGDVFHGWVGVRYRSGGNATISGRIPSSGTEGMSSPTSKYYNWDVIAIHKIDDHDAVSFGITTIDEDRGNAADKILGTVQQIATTISKLPADSNSIFTNTIKLGAEITSAIAGAMKESMTDNDDLISQYSWIFTPAQMWGWDVEPSELSGYNNYGGYFLKVQLE